MHYFEYKNGELYCEEVPIKKILEDVGTPVYIYSAKTIKRHYKVFEKSFSDIDYLICYSVKANSNIAIISLLKQLGSGADIVSAGELKRVLKAGIDPKKLFFLE